MKRRPPVRGGKFRAGKPKTKKRERGRGRGKILGHYSNNLRARGKQNSKGESGKKKSRNHWGAKHALKKPKRSPTGNS